MPLQVMDIVMHDLVCNSTAFLQQWAANSDSLCSGVATRTAKIRNLICRQIPELKEALSCEVRVLQQVMLLLGCLPAGAVHSQMPNVL